MRLRHTIQEGANKLCLPCTILGRELCATYCTLSANLVNEPPLSKMNPLTPKRGSFVSQLESFAIHSHVLCEIIKTPHGLPGLPWGVFVLHRIDCIFAAYPVYLHAMAGASRAVTQFVIDGEHQSAVSSSASTKKLTGRKPSLHESMADLGFFIQPS